MPHPNRSRAAPREDRNPTPQEVRDARMAAGLSQSEAAALVLGTTRGWQGYEADEGSDGHRRMHPGLFLLFRARVAIARGELGEAHDLLLKGATP